MLVSIMGAMGNVRAQRINLKQDKAQLKNILIEISKQSGYTFIYDEEDLKNIQPISINTSNKTITALLNELLHEKSLDYQIKGRSIAIERKPIQQIAIKNSEIKIQKRTVTGRITNENGQPLAGINVLIKGSTIGTSTNAQGQFSIVVPEANSILSISSIGYISTEISSAGKSEFNIVLKTANSNLEEVVVVGFGTQKKENLTGAVSTVSAKRLADRPIANLGQGLQGLVPNLNITSANGKPGTGSQFNIRGTGSINGGTAGPLILVDGV